ncbi:MAG: thiosulfate oxidation carrier protein SoxY [Burkholderiaceae bacterium]|jgi:sulfur-oxidizing protein SoxY|nr:thiosulfate oxidation carrier protein SoxY [Burkholderiaceae bacterium]
MNTTRRQVIKTAGALSTLVSLGIITQAQALAAETRPGFEAKSYADAIGALGAKPADSGDIQVVTPDIAENGAVVPVGAVSNIPNTTDIWFLVEKNPFPMAAGFSIPAGTKADVQTRLKMGQTSNVTVVVKADGKLYAASKETKVTLGGCGG